jgi:Tfp pilus assembly protein PilF
MISMKRIRLVLLIALTVTGLSVLFLYPEDPARTYRRHVDRADTYLAAQKYREATVEYRAALKIDPKAGTSRYRLGQAFAAIEDHGNAYREFVRAADLLPEDTDAQLTAVKYLLRAQQFEDARSRVDHLLARQPKLVEAQVLRGSALAGLRDVDGAITQMEEALALDPDRADTYVNLGVLHRARGNNRGAEEVFERALKMDPASVNARLALANYHWSAGRLADAEALIKDAVGVERDGARASRTLAIFYLASGRAADAEQPLRTVAERSADVQPKLMLADYYMAGGRAPQAVAVLESVAKDPRASGLAGARLAAIAYASDTQRGHALVDEVLARDTATPYAHLVKARMLLAEKRYVDAEQQTRAALALDSRTAAAHYLLGTIFLALNNPADAVRAFNEVLAVNPRAVDAQLQLARIHLAHGRKDAAVQFAEQAVKNQPTDGRARLILARALIARGDLRSADAELKLLLAGSAPGAAVHNALATWHIASGRPDAARAAFERAHALDASDLEALTGLVTFDLQERRVGGAQQRVDAALAKRATDPRLHMLAAAVRSSAGDAAGAEEALGRAIEADPTQLEAYGLLAQLYIKQDRLTDARLKYEEFCVEVFV